MQKCAIASIIEQFFPVLNLRGSLSEVDIIAICIGNFAAFISNKYKQLLQVFVMRIAEAARK